MKSLVDARGQVCYILDWVPPPPPPPSPPPKHSCLSILILEKDALLYIEIRLMARRTTSLHITDYNLRFLYAKETTISKAVEPVITMMTIADQTK